MTDYTYDNTTMVVSVHIGNDSFVAAKLINALSIVPPKGCKISIKCYRDLEVVTVGFDPILNVYHVECVTDNQEVIDEYKETGMVIIDKSDFWGEVDVVHYEDSILFEGTNLYFALNVGDFFELENNVFEYDRIESIEYGCAEQTTHHRVITY
jgi:hypothetical protein